MVWYLFHTLGELCISPVALSLVSKLVPGRMIAFMFAIYYLAVAIGMKLAGVFGEGSEAIAKESGISHFFWILTGVSVGLAVLCVILYPKIKYSYTQKTKLIFQHSYSDSMKNHT